MKWMQPTAATLIHEARLRAGLSQRELAKLSGTSQAVVSAYENGGREPGYDRLRQVVKAAGFVVEVRLLPIGAPPEGDIWLAADSPEDDDRILENLALSPAERLRKMGRTRDFAARYRGALARR